jgi:transcriptional regulator with XRE-family HTH domain
MKRQRFRDLLSERRRAKKITLRKLGELTNLSPSYLSALENGRRFPPTDHEKLQDLAIILDLDKDQLIEAARKERIRRKPNFFEKLVDIDPELAWGLCRDAEKVSDKDLEEIFRNTLKTLESKAGNHDGRGDQ